MAVRSSNYDLIKTHILAHSPHSMGAEGGATYFVSYRLGLERMIVEGCQKACANPIVFGMPLHWGMRLSTRRLAQVRAPNTDGSECKHCSAVAGFGTYRSGALRPNMPLCEASMLLG